MNGYFIRWISGEELADGEYQSGYFSACDTDGKIVAKLDFCFSKIELEFDSNLTQFQKNEIKNQIDYEFSRIESDLRDFDLTTKSKYLLKTFEQSTDGRFEIPARDTILGRPIYLNFND